MSKELEILLSNVDACGQRIEKLAYWCDSEQRIGLGHRRLAIVDLSPAGHQPMVSASGRLSSILDCE